MNVTVKIKDPKEFGCTKGPRKNERGEAALEC